MKGTNLYSPNLTLSIVLKSLYDQSGLNGGNNDLERAHIRIIVRGFEKETKTPGHVGPKARISKTFAFSLKVRRRHMAPAQQLFAKTMSHTSRYIFLAARCHTRTHLFL